MTAGFRAALLAVPAVERDAWVDRLLGLHAIPDDGPALPRGGVPYLPCAVEALLRVVELAEVTSTDVVVDVGAGVGRAAAVLHLLTGAATIGLEIQPALVQAAHDLVTRRPTLRFEPVEGDAPQLTGHLARGTVFFLYCPFGGDRLASLLDRLEAVAATRPIRVATVDLPLPSRPWLTLTTPADDAVAVYRSR